MKNPFQDLQILEKPLETEPEDLDKHSIYLKNFSYAKWKKKADIMKNRVEQIPKRQKAKTWGCC